MNTESLSPGNICCVAEHKLKDFIELYKAINSYGENFKGMAGLPGKDQSVCLARCNGQWHRACVKEATGTGKPIMRLIDVYSNQRINVNDVIPMPEIFGMPPVMSELCKVEGYEDIKKTSPNLIEEGKMITVNEITFNKKILVLHFNATKQL